MTFDAFFIFPGCLSHALPLPDRVAPAGVSAPVHPVHQAAGGQPAVYGEGAHPSHPPLGTQTWPQGICQLGEGGHSVYCIYDLFSQSFRMSAQRCIAC